MSISRLLCATSLIATAIALPASAKTTFEFWYGLSGDLSNRIQEMCQSFNAAQDDYEIKCISQDTYENNLQATIAAFRANMQPTISQISDGGTLDLMLSGAYVPVRQLMEENGYDIDWSDYFPGIAAYYATSQGEMLSMPFNSSTAVIYYNTGALADVGFDGVPETWEQVEDVAQRMKDAGYECPIAFDPTGIWQWFEQAAMVADIPLANRGNGYEGLDAELVFNRNAMVDQVAFYKRLYDNGLMVHKSRTAGETANEAFMQGHCQISSSSIADHGTFSTQSAEGVQWTAAMLPIWEGTTRTNSVVGGASLWTLQGKSPEEYKGAAAFYAFIADPEQARWWSTVTGYIPVTNSAFQALSESGFYDAAPFKGRELAIASLTATAPTENTRGLRLGNFNSIRTQLGEMMQSVLFSDVPVQTALDETAARGNEVLRRFERTYNGVQLP
ncbi:sn-glycerol 3-phosphate ABC transporter substrate binding protein [Ketogulonicigenium robustum]|uniref:sn-glycerol-3-phosphate-binding periplasmic protein UgpB n=1 Tax=Ketogulonicigenium robustum TaxID=92947 RepID=A0A1W6NX98_9RHOB|nr:extracellular solute-binding protein [Ketogulonicigenium robustum]ARO13811.1 sn-glycerol 3-phosphate ABC transporter substrate binding protein [Ketogulonicigenium robustum]